MVVVDITSSGMPCGMVKYNKHVIYVNFLTYQFRARGIHGRCLVSTPDAFSLLGERMYWVMISNSGSQAIHMSVVSILRSN